MSIHENMKMDALRTLPQITEAVSDITSVLDTSEPYILESMRVLQIVSSKLRACAFDLDEIVLKAQSQQHREGTK